jgi:hypothetical protein
MWKFCFILDIVKNEYNIFIYEDVKVCYIGKSSFVHSDGLYWLDGIRIAHFSATGHSVFH